MDMTQVEALISENLFAVWFLIGAALVFWMQAGFAMVEAGFTRAKNSGNIIMKNLMDFCIGTVMFILIGFSLLLGEDLAGFIGKPGFDIFTAYENFDFSNFVFNLVFCATTATIVSGAMAERTKFLSYCIYSAVISALVYPVEAHWIWGGGWLADMGFHDYAGSCAIHMVGGIAAIIGAKLLGPRIGKFTKDKDGKIVKVNAFPGHNLPIGCLGVFILWLGWYGFNGAAATDIPTLGSVFLTTTVAPAVATVVAMLFTWFKYGHPDVSMSLNASLAGLLVIFGVWLLDYVLHIDDPVGAVGVHMMNGIWGTIAVGLFATDTAPGFAKAGIKEGLFYGGGFNQLGLQLLGFVAVAGWAAVTMFFAFSLVKLTVGLRVTEEEEILGLDVTEHGLTSAYAGFSIIDIDSTMDVNENTYLGVGEYNEASEAQKNAALKVVKTTETYPAVDNGMRKIVIICKLSKFDALKRAMNRIGVTGMTMTQVMGSGVERGSSNVYRGTVVDNTLIPKIKVDIIISNRIKEDDLIEAAKRALYTGHIGDGKIFVYNINRVIKVRTGEEDMDALADVE